jgi:hypothetical protein
VAISVVVLHCRIIRVIVNVLLPHLVVEAEIIVGMAFLQREAETPGVEPGGKQGCGSGSGLDPDPGGQKLPTKVEKKI